MKRRTNQVLLAVAIMLLAGLMPRAEAGTIYARPTGTGGGTGWGDATSLTNALRIGRSGDSIWLEQGTYTNAATFTVASNNVSIYGGFTTSMTLLSERDWTAYPVILSANSNAWRVVTVTGTNVTLDGLVMCNSFGNTTAGGLTKTGTGPLLLANCTITNNALRFTAGVGCSFTAGSVLMTNCVVAGNYIPHNAGSYINTGKYGIGIYASGANLEIVDCVISNQSADTADARSTAGGGLSFDNGTCRVARTTFVSNRGPNNGAGGGAVYLHSGATMSAVFSNCVFRNNQVDNSAGSDGYGGAVWANLNPARTAAFVNCTFAYNTNRLGHGGAVYLSGGTLELRNCILWTNRVTNTGKLGHDIGQAGGTLRASYSGLTGTGQSHLYASGGSATLSNCMTNDPLFAGAADLHVKSPAGRYESGSWVTTDPAYSPAIDASDPSDPVGSEPADNGSRRNLGAYGGTAQASKSPAPQAPKVTNRAEATNFYSRMVLSGELTNDAPVIATVGLCYGTNNIVADTTNGWQYVSVLYPPRQTGTVFSVTTPYLLTNTTYYFRWFATNATGESWAPVSNFTTVASYPPLWDVGGGANVVHVRPGAIGEADGRDWFNAYTTLAAGIAAISGSRTNLWITGGTYSEGAVLTLGSAATVIGGFAAGETTVAGRTLTNALGVVTNYTAINGENSHQCLIITATGSVWLDTVSVSNTSPRRALEKSGSGVLTMNNCRLEKNSLVNNNTGGAGNGLGGYFTAGSIYMTNCVIVDNRYPQATGNEKYGNKGMGIYATGVILDIVDCVFSNQGASADASTARTHYGAGLAFDNGTCRVARTAFVNNWGSGNGGGGGAVYLGNGAALAASFSNCLFRGNVLEHGGGSGGGGGAVYAAMNAARTSLFVNCTFVSNNVTQQTSGGGAIRLDSGTVILKNCILWTNRCSGSGSTGYELSRGGGTLDVRYSSISAQTSPQIDGAVTFTDGRVGDPGFASIGDVHLQSTAGRWDPATRTWLTSDSSYSFCIDFGDPADPVGAEPAPNGSRINMGYYGGTAEASKSPPAPTPPLLAHRGAEVNYDRVKMSGELTNAGLVAANVYLCYGAADGGTTTGGWTTVTSFGDRQNNGVFYQWTPALSPATTYTYRWFATNANGQSWTTADTFLTGTTPPSGGATVIHVNKNATGAADGTSWSHAFTKIADGISAISGSRTNIWITGNTYQEGLLLNLATDATIVGGFAGTESAVAQRARTNALGVVTNYTTIDGEAAHGCLKTTAGNVWLDSITFTNALYGGGLGGTLIKSGANSLTANNCRFVGAKYYSYSGYGLGCYFTGGTVLLTNCVVSGHTVIGNTWGHQGVGVYSVGANLTMVDCEVSDNDNNGAGGSDSRGSTGFGLYFDDGTLEVVRTDFFDNWGGCNNGSGGGGAVYLGPNADMAATFRNCLFRNNRALYQSDAGYGYGGAFWVNLNSLAKTVTVENCTFSDNRNETGGGGTPGRGGAFYVSKGTVVIKNSILWTNVVKDATSGREIYADSANSRVEISYSDFTGTNSPYVVTANSAVAVVGDGVITNNPLYASATDLHLQAEGGRWNPVTRAWVVDAATSPCIDAGNPADPAGAESSPNGNRINMGRYGGTAEASRTKAAGTLFMFR